jgi:hypothetical protein
LLLTGWQYNSAIDLERGRVSEIKAGALMVLMPWLWCGGHTSGSAAAYLGHLPPGHN